MPVWVVGVESTIADGVHRHRRIYQERESAARALGVESEILAGD